MQKTRIYCQGLGAISNFILIERTNNKLYFAQNNYLDFEANCSYNYDDQIGYIPNSQILVERRHIVVNIGIFLIKVFRMYQYLPMSMVISFRLNDVSRSISLLLISYFISFYPRNLRVYCHKFAPLEVYYSLYLMH